MSGGRILVVGPNWIGDTVIADTLLKLLKRGDPPVKIDMLVPPALAPLAARMREVSEAIDAPGGHGRLTLGGRLRLAGKLARRGYERAYVLPRSAKAALVPWLARIPYRIGYRGESRYGLINDMRRINPAHVSLAERYAALADCAGEALPPVLPRPQLSSEESERNALVGRLKLDAGARPVALTPGADYGPAKRWPVTAYIELAARLADDGREPWILGSTGERELGQTISSAVPRARDLTGQTSLVEAVDLLAAASAAVTNDSGLMHVAAAVGTPLVAIYGSSSPRYTPPLGRAVGLVYHALPCSPCFARTCPLGHLNCLRGIGAAEVYAELTALENK